MEKIKPIINQEVFIYCPNLHPINNKELYIGKVFEVTETPLAERYRIHFTFSILSEPIYQPPTDILTESTRERKFNSSSFHLEPTIFDNIEWTLNGRFASAFIFYSKESFEKWKDDVRKSKREYHLQQAELYK